MCVNSGLYKIYLKNLFWISNFNFNTNCKADFLNSYRYFKSTNLQKTSRHMACKFPTFARLWGWVWLIYLFNQAFLAYFYPERIFDK